MRTGSTFATARVLVGAGRAEPREEARDVTPGDSEEDADDDLGQLDRLRGTDAGDE